MKSLVRMETLLQVDDPIQLLLNWTHTPFESRFNLKALPASFSLSPRGGVDPRKLVDETPGAGIATARVKAR